MKMISATDLAIALAHKEGHLVVKERFSERTGETYISIEDKFSLIEVHNSQREADDRLASILGRLA